MTDTTDTKEGGCHCGAIRYIQIDAGYSFEIDHDSKGGIYHLHVSIVSPAGAIIEKITKTVLNDLRDELYRAFANLSGHDCCEDGLSTCRLASNRFVIGACACFAVLGIFIKQALRIS